MHRRVAPALLVAVAATAVATPAVAATNSADTTTAPTFSVIGDLSVPQIGINGQTFGGLSGIDYDAATQSWRAITNDGSNHGPARFYSLSLGVTGSALQSKLAATRSIYDAWFRIAASSTPLLRADGTTYPPSANAGQDTVEPTAIRFDPIDNSVFWANAGVNTGALSLTPSVRESGTDGSFLQETPQASQLVNGSATSGIRNGEGLSGLTFTAGGFVDWSTVAGPLLQDGPNPTATTGANTRILGQSRALGFPVLSEYAYPLDRLPLTDANGNGTNQVADILAVDDTHFLVLERGTAPGKGNSVRLYEVDITTGFDVVGLPSLNGANFTPVSKKLLVDFSNLNLKGGVANFSGLTWGPTLSNGDRSLVLVSDNGFNSNTATRILGLDVHGL